MGTAGEKRLVLVSRWALPEIHILAHASRPKTRRANEAAGAVDLVARLARVSITATVTRAAALMPVGHLRSAASATKSADTVSSASTSLFAVESMNARMG